MCSLIQNLDADLKKKKKESMDMLLINYSWEDPDSIRTIV